MSNIFKMKEGVIMLSQAKKILIDNWFIPIIFLIVVAMNLFVCRVGLTVGSSMYPTLSNNEPILISVMKKNDIKRMDIIVFKNGWRCLVKRVIGLPGETIYIKDNIIYIDDNPITDAVDIKMETYGCAEKPIELKEDEYFVMGDNRNNSNDSRAFGAIKRESIMGIVTHGLSPYTKFEHKE